MNDFLQHTVLSFSFNLSAPFLTLFTTYGVILLEIVPESVFVNLPSALILIPSLVHR